MTYSLFPVRRQLLCAVLLAALLSTAANAAKLRQVAILDMPGQPGFDSLALVNKHLVISHHGAGSLDVFDPSRRRLVAKITGFANTKGIAVNEADGKFYVADAGNNQIAVVSSETWQVTNTIKLDHSPDSLLFIPDGRMLYVGSAHDRYLTLVRTESSQPIGSLQLDSHPQGMAYDPVKKQVLVALEDQDELVTLSAFSAEAAIQQHIKLAASQPTALLFDQGNRRIYVAVRYAILSIDPDSGNEISRIPTAAGTNSLWLDATSNTLYSAADDGTVNTINVAGGRLILDKELRTEVRGSGVAYDAERKLIYVPGGREGRSKLVILKELGTQGQPEPELRRTAKSHKAENR